jgi:hypothetical protein
VNDEMRGKENQKMTARILTVALAATAFLLAVAPAAFAAAPVFKLTATAQPTNFVAGSSASPITGPEYSVIATNVGSAATDGPVTFSDTLPAGLTARAVPNLVEVRGLDSNSEGNAALSCNVSGQTIVCIEPHPLRPGQWAQLLIPVEVDENASGDVVNEASVVGGGASEATLATTTAISESIPSFDFLPGPSGFGLAAIDTGGQAATQAGSHPYGLTVDLGFPTAEAGASPGVGGVLYNPGHPKDLTVRLPRGMAANPNAAPARCTEAQLEAEPVDGIAHCPIASQIGVVTVLTKLTGLNPIPSGLYNMVPPPGVAAEFGTNVGELNISVHLMGDVNSAGEYELGAETTNILAREKNPVLGIQAQLWGDPSDPSHDAMRGECLVSPACSNPVERLGVPFLTLPSSCRSSLTATAVATSWEEPQSVTRSAQLEDPSNGIPTSTNGCGALEFKPQISAKPTTDLSDAPTGLDFNLHVPQTDKSEELATANFKDVKVTFPPGVAVNPSGANGLGACSTSQIGYQPREGKVRFSEDPATCPDSAKIGSVEVETPLLDHPLPGAVYTATPFDNPFNSFLAVYIAVDDPQTGVVSKLAGRVETDPSTGQITTIFTENPELPIEDVRLKLFDGPRAALKTPLVCNTYSVTSEITPWSTPEGASVSPSASFATSVAAGGSGACPTSEAAAPNHPTFTAGTIAPQAGAYSPFVLKLSREDGSQRFASIETTLAKGLVARLAGVPYCSEAQIAAAKAREAPGQGTREQQSPSCPAASQVGTVNVGAGAGTSPFYTQGRAYWAGPYKGAPLSLLIITPAVAGPFDLGAVVVRTALYLNSETAEVRAVSDPLPTVLQGIPLDIRSIALTMDRPNFTLNPTSCDPKSITGVATSTIGQSAPLSDRFQVGDCRRLKFAPKLAISLKGGTRRTKHPALRGVLTYPTKGDYANVARAQVTLPHSAFLDQAHIKTICTRVQFAAEQCPKASVYGFARAFTPLLDKPVEGPVYLRSSSHELPDLVAALHGQIDVDLVGRIDTGKGGGIRTTFEAAPDAPVSKFVLEMQGGKKGLLVNSENICKKPQRAIASLTAQNGKVSNTTPLIGNSCGKKKHKKHKTRGR